MTGHVSASGVIRRFSARPGTRRPSYEGSCRRPLRFAYGCSCVHCRRSALTRSCRFGAFAAPASESGRPATQGFQVLISTEGDDGQR